jgi:hypothetical protein
VFPGHVTLFCNPFIPSVTVKRSPGRHNSSRCLIRVAGQRPGTVGWCRQPRSGPAAPGLRIRPDTVGSVPEEFDPEAMIERFRGRAAAVRSRGMPPIEGADRQRYIEQARIDFMDYAMLGDAEASLEDGVLTLRVDLRPKPDSPKTEG